MKLLLLLLSLITSTVYVSLAFANTEAKNEARGAALPAIQFYLNGINDYRIGELQGKNIDSSQVYLWGPEVDDRKYRGRRDIADIRDDESRRYWSSREREDYIPYSPDTTPYSIFLRRHSSEFLRRHSSDSAL